MEIKTHIVNSFRGDIGGIVIDSETKFNDIVLIIDKLNSVKHPLKLDKLFVNALSKNYDSITKRFEDSEKALLRYADLVALRINKLVSNVEDYESFETNDTNRRNDGDRMIDGIARSIFVPYTVRRISLALKRLLANRAYEASIRLALDYLEVPYEDVDVVLHQVPIIISKDDDGTERVHFGKDDCLVYLGEFGDEVYNEHPFHEHGFRSISDDGSMVYEVYPFDDLSGEYIGEDRGHHLWHNGCVAQVDYLNGEQKVYVSAKGEVRLKLFSTEDHDTEILLYKDTTGNGDLYDAIGYYIDNDEDLIDAIDGQNKDYFVEVIDSNWYEVEPDNIIDYDNYLVLDDVSTYDELSSSEVSLSNIIENALIEQYLEEYKKSRERWLVGMMEDYFTENDPDFLEMRENQ